MPTFLRRRRDPKPALASELDWSASVHDDSQVELTFDYTASEPVEQGVLVEDVRPRFAVDVYLVAPAALDLDSDTYPKERFLADLTHRMRLHAPEIPGFDEGLVVALDRYLALDLDFAGKSALAPRVIQQTKLFANYFNFRLKQVFVGNQPRPGLKYTRDLSETISLLDNFRARYADAMRESSLLFDDEVRDAVLWVEAYLSDRARSALSRVALAGKRKALRALVREAEHEVVDSPLSEGDDEAVERYFHRYGQLKKYVAEVLYLNRRELHRDRLYRNLAAATGAAIAAMFAETARYYNNTATGTTDFGFRVAFFLAIAVMAYVFKDRLKDLSKEYFGRRVMSAVPDRDSELMYDYVDESGDQRHVLVAQHHEFISHMSSLSLREDVAYVRQRCEAADLGIDRDVLRYSKVTWLAPEALNVLEYTTLSVKDILRLDLTNFLSHLDNPLKELALYDSEEGSVVVEAPKVYHLDLVIRMERGVPTTDGVNASVSVEVVRVILDKNGIVRLEEPVERGRYRYMDAR
ncbi:MAG: hypothetical protein ACJARS_003449 [bacterium]